MLELSLEEAELGPGLEEWMDDWNYRGEKGIIVASLEENVIKYMLSPREM